MAGPARYIFMVSMDVDPEKEALFNAVYDEEHVPNLLTVPGVHAAWPLKAEPSFALNIAGEERMIANAGVTYYALYDIDGPHVLTRAAWAAAEEAGRWPAEVRPFTRNRRHALYKAL